MNLHIHIYYICLYRICVFIIVAHSPLLLLNFTAPTDLYLEKWHFLLSHREYQIFVYFVFVSIASIPVKHAPSLGKHSGIQAWSPPGQVNIILPAILATHLIHHMKDAESESNIINKNNTTVINSLYLCLYCAYAKLTVNNM